MAWSPCPSEGPFSTECVCDSIVIHLADPASIIWTHLVWERGDSISEERIAVGRPWSSVEK